MLERLSRLRSRRRSSSARIFSATAVRRACSAVSRARSGPGGAARALSARPAASASGWQNIVVGTPARWAATLVRGEGGVGMKVDLVASYRAHCTNGSCNHVTRYAACDARWSALRPHAVPYGIHNLELQLWKVRPSLVTHSLESALRPHVMHYGMPDLELQLGKVRPPLGTRPCAQRSVHAAVTRVVDELRAVGAAAEGQ